MSDQQIIYKRKMGYSLKDVYEYHESYNPYLDNFINLCHVVRICYEQNLPFEAAQIKRVFNKVHNKVFHGNKSSCWKYIAHYAGKKILCFKTPVYNQKVASSPMFFDKTSDMAKDMNQNNEYYAPNQDNQLNLGDSDENS